MKTFEVSILTQEKKIYQGKVVSLVVPAFRGYLGVLLNHAPLISAILPGKITLREPQEEVVLHAKGKGFMEVLNNKVTILL